jgi:hypothetical protein
MLVVPITGTTARSGALTWLAVGALCVIAIWLFRLRRKFRTFFLVPLCWVPFVTGIYFRDHHGDNSSGFLVSITLLFVLFAGGMLLDAFWSPYADDLADQEWLEQFKE